MSMHALYHVSSEGVLTANGAFQDSAMSCLDDDHTMEMVPWASTCIGSSRLPRGCPVGRGGDEEAYTVLLSFDRHGTGENG
jgi:hypothetical protein